MSVPSRRRLCLAYSVVLRSQGINSTELLLPTSVRADQSSPAFARILENYPISTHGFFSFAHINYCRSMAYNGEQFKRSPRKDSDALTRKSGSLKQPETVLQLHSEATLPDYRNHTHSSERQLYREAVGHPDRQQESFCLGFCRSLMACHSSDSVLIKSVFKENSGVSLWKFWRLFRQLFPHTRINIPFQQYFCKVSSIKEFQCV